MGKDIVQYTITGAQDWPMFVWWFSVFGAVISVLLGVIITLVALVWREMRAGFRQHRQEETVNCEKHRETCRDEMHRTHDAVWKAIDGLREQRG